MSKMERSRRLSGSSFGVSSGRSEPNASEKPENAIDILARELGGGLPAKPAGVPSSRQPNYNPLSSAAAASGQLTALPPNRRAGSLEAPERKVTAAGAEWSDNSRNAQRIDSNRTAGPSSGEPLGLAGGKPRYSQAYSPMRASRLGSGQQYGSDTDSSVATRGYESKDPGRRDTGVSLIDQMPGLSLQSSSSLNTPKQELVAVDGVPQHTVDIWFAEADSSGSGSIADRDAITFFKRTGLSPTVLSTIWNRVKAVSVSGQPGLNRPQFSMALRLVALAQSGQPLTDDTLTRRAVSPRRWQAAGHAPLPPPHLMPLPRMSTDSSRRVSSESQRGRQHQRSKTAGMIDLADLHGESGQEAFATLAAQRRAINPASNHSDQDREPMGESPSAQRAAGRMTETPICFEARLPPLHPKKCSRLTMLVSGHGSLFAAPSSGGGLLQWGRPEGNMRRPEVSSGSHSEDIVVSERSWAALHEDPDIAPSSETLVPESKLVSCTFVDEVTNILWVGHADGRITAFSLGPTAGQPINSSRIVHWQAHKMGRVTAICTTAWGELWTASSRGTIRTWRVEATAGASVSVSPARELRRQGGMRAHTHAVNFLVVPPCGQVVWSGSAKTLLIWCAYTGAYLGFVQRGQELELDRETSSRKLVEASEKDERPVPRLVIDQKQGLELDSQGKIVVKAFASRRKEIIAEQEAWAVQTDKKTSEWVENVVVHGGKGIDNIGKAAGKAGKFFGRVGGRIVRNIKGDNVANSELRAQLTGATSFLGAKAPRVSLDTNGLEISFGAGEQGEEGGEAEAAERVGKDGTLKALIADNGNCVWAAYQHGKMERYSFNGRLLTKKDLGVGICSLAVVGPRLWVGLMNGRIQVLADKNVNREWRAHEASVVQLAVTGSRIYSLAMDGSIKGWCSTVPSEYDYVARQALDNAAASLIEQQKLEVLCVTWNVNEQKPDGRSPFFGVVSRLAAPDNVQVVVFGLQEIEMGGGSVAMAAAKDALHKKAQEKGNTNGQWWATQLLLALGGPKLWHHCGLRQLSGMLVVVFARTELEGKIGEVSTSSVACGVLGVGGNKGAVAVSFTLCRRRIACVCSHFAAHQGAVEARYNNYVTIVKNLTFSKLPWYDLQVSADEDAEQPHKQASRLLLEEAGPGDSNSDNETPSEAADADMLQGQGMRAAEMLVWMGDFNYRINCGYEDAKENIRRGRLETLLERDQLKAEIKAGRVFRHLREGAIRFPPTYKFNKNDPDPFGYDSSEKRRVPAWTDRIFFRGSLRKDMLQDDESFAGSLIDGFEPEEHPRVGKAEAITVEAVAYAAGMEVNDSDHKPVWARLLVNLPVTMQDKKRRKCSHLLKDCFLHSVPEPPQVLITPELITLHPLEERSGVLKVQNRGSSAVVVRVVPLVESWQRPPTNAPRAIPDWLDIFPISARVAPQAVLEISVALALSEASWERREKRALLRLRVDHDFAAGGERPEGGYLRDQPFTVVSTMQSLC